MPWVRPTAVTVIVWIGVVVAGWTVPATAMADPADDPCRLAVSLRLCGGERKGAPATQPDSARLYYRARASAS